MDHLMSESNNVTSITTKSRNDLNMQENFDLILLVKDEYASSGLTDKAFAEYAMTKIKLREGAKIFDHTVKARRAGFDIPSNKQGPKPAEDPSAYTAMLLSHETQLKELTERVNMLETWVNATFPTRSKQKVI